MSGHVHGGWLRGPDPGVPSGIAALGLPGRWAGPLVCATCGIPWPGEPLPDPYMSLNAGYGDLGQLQPWRRRVKSMAHDLAELDVRT